MAEVAPIGVEQANRAMLQAVFGGAAGACGLTATFVVCVGGAVTLGVGVGVGVGLGHTDVVIMKSSMFHDETVSAPAAPTCMPLKVPNCFSATPRILGHEHSGELVEADGADGLESGDAVSFIPYFNCGNCIACRRGKPNCCMAIEVLGVHVDGAFGLWAAASDELRHRVAGLERADSWTVDGHKMLNVPYDSGYAFCAHPDVHATAMACTRSWWSKPRAKG